MKYLVLLIASFIFTITAVAQKGNTNYNLEYIKTTTDKYGLKTMFCSA